MRKLFRHPAQWQCHFSFCVTKFRPTGVLTNGLYNKPHVFPTLPKWHEHADGTRHPDPDENNGNKSREELDREVVFGAIERKGNDLPCVSLECSHLSTDL